LGSWPTLPGIPRFFECARNAGSTRCGDERIHYRIHYRIHHLIDITQLDVCRIGFAGFSASRAPRAAQ
jgi:hypothetical protein